MPEPEFRKKKRRISIVWLVPLVALAIGGWLVYKAISEKGPIITITFKAATGLEAGRPEPDADEILEVRRVPVSEALEMALDGRITDSLSILALTAYALRGAGTGAPDGTGDGAGGG